MVKHTWFSASRSEFNSPSGYQSIDNTSYAHCRLRMRALVLIDNCEPDKELLWALDVLNLPRALNFSG